VPSALCLLPSSRVHAEGNAGRCGRFGRVLPNKAKVKSKKVKERINKKG
jgi:hypothetical protein